jgi:DNA/RNA-binding domain of Phe-tRNA-synthetase-like protein
LERVDSALFGIVPEFARATIRFELESGRASEVAMLTAYCAGVARRTLAREREAVGHTASTNGATVAVRSAAASLGTDVHVGAADAATAAELTWEVAYERLGMGPDVVPPHRALEGWVRATGRIPSQGAILDLVNAFSLAAGLPAAAYDVRRATGGLWLRPARGHESYTALDGSVDAPAIGEIVLADGSDTVMARHWHGSPGAEFAPSGASTEVRLHVDVLHPNAPEEAARRAGRSLVALAESMLGGRATLAVLHGARPAVAWEK